MSWTGQSQEALAQTSTESAQQSHGSCLPNLRCSDVEGGLLGRSLITLCSNKVSCHPQLSMQIWQTCTRNHRHPTGTQSQLTTFLL